MRKIARKLLVLLRVVVVIGALETAIMVWAWRRRNPRALRLIKAFNKSAINPVMLRFSGRSGPSAVVHHVGRRSGTPYATPVIAHQSHQDVIIPLPYGTEVDWLRNLFAAGRAVVDLEGRSFRVDEPEVVDIDNVIGLLPTPMVRAVRFNGARDAVRLRVKQSATSAPAGGPRIRQEGRLHSRLKQQTLRATAEWKEQRLPVFSLQVATAHTGRLRSQQLAV